MLQMLSLIPDFKQVPHLSKYHVVGNHMSQLILTLNCSRYRKREIERQEYLKDVEQEQFIPSDETLSEMLDQSSGSGSGLPLLVSLLRHGFTQSWSEVSLTF